jgi:hypothetical protein
MEENTEVSLSVISDGDEESLMAFETVPGYPVSS